MLFIPLIGVDAVTATMTDRLGRVRECTQSLQSLVAQLQRIVKAEHDSSTERVTRIFSVIRKSLMTLIELSVSSSDAVNNNSPEHKYTAPALMEMEKLETENHVLSARLVCLLMNYCKHQSACQSCC